MTEANGEYDGNEKKMTKRESLRVKQKILVNHVWCPQCQNGPCIFPIPGGKNHETSQEDKCKEQASEKPLVTIPNVISKFPIQAYV